MWILQAPLKLCLNEHVEAIGINGKLFFLWLQWYMVSELLGMDQTSFSYDSFTASCKSAEKEVDIIADTKHNPTVLSHHR